MSEEAVVRIILQDGTGTSTGSPAPPAPNQTPGSPAGTPPQQSSRSHPAPSPSPPPAGAPRPQQTSSTPTAQHYQQQPSTTTTQTQPPWVNYLIDSLTRNVKQLATQLSGGRLTPPTTATHQTSGTPQPLQQAQTSLPQFNTSVIPVAGQITAPPQYQSPPAIANSPSPSYPSATPTSAPQPQIADVGNSRASEAAKRGAETRRRNQERLYAYINNNRRTQAQSTGGVDAQYTTIQEEMAEAKRLRTNELARERRRKKKQITAGATDSAVPAVPTSDLDVLTESLGMGPAVVETEPQENDRPYPTSVGKPNTMRNVSEALGLDTSEEVKRRAKERRAENKRRKDNGEPPLKFTSGGNLPPKMGKFVSSGSMDEDVVYREMLRTQRRRAAEKAARSDVHEVKEDDLLEQPWWLDHQSDGGELPRFARGGFFKRMFGAGQKDTAKPYNAATWMENNRAIDALRGALGAAGYNARDVSNLASNKDILGMWKSGWSLADLRRTGLIPYDPHNPSDIEVVPTEEPRSAEVDLSIPQYPPPPLPGVKVDKRGRIITARKGKSKRPIEGESEAEDSSDAEKPLPLTRKRPKPFFSDGGDLPRYASGGAIVGDLPGQSIESIKSDPHTEVIMGGRVYSHSDSLRHGLFDGKKPRYAWGSPFSGGPPWVGRRRRRMGLPPVTYGWANTATEAGKTLGIPGAGALSRVAEAGSMGESLGAGPAGAIIEAVKQVTAAAIGANKAVIGGAGAAANWAASGPDVGRDISALGSAASKAGEDLSKISPIAGVMVNAFGEAGKALGGFMQAMDKTVDRYAEVNPAIAQQQAIGEIRQVMGDMRRGQEGASEIVRYMQTQQDLQQKFEDIKIKLLNQILKVVNPILEVLERIIPEGEAVEEAIRALLAPLAMLAEMAAAIANVQRDDRMPVVQDPAQILLDLQNRPDGPDVHIGNRNNFNRG